jgi:hypothetical protein
MILSKAGKLSLLAGLLCLLLMGFAGASYGAVRWDTVQSPTEVINTGRSEVLGSVTLYAAATGITGTVGGGYAQIGFIYNQGIQIDNLTTTGIKLFTNIAFPTATPATIAVQNIVFAGRCSGFLTINLPPGINVAPGDYLRVEGVRGRIDLSDGLTVGTDLFVQLQSINDPAANQFSPDTVRVAKSLPGLVVNVTDATALLCFPSIGTIDGSNPKYSINVKEGFVRAFVNKDSTMASKPRTDDYGLELSSPTNATQIRLVLNSIPLSIGSISWPGTVFNNQDGATTWLEFVSLESNTSGTGINSSRYGRAIYQYKSKNQTGYSDITLEDFDVVPVLNITGSDLTATGTVLAAATLYPDSGTAGDCEAPGGSNQGTNNFTDNRPRFKLLYQSSGNPNVTDTSPTSNKFDVYATVVRCNCYLLFTYMTKDSFWNTGIAIANTTGDDEVFGATVYDKNTGITTGGAPNQVGGITFYFYDAVKGYVGSTSTTTTYGPGQSFVGLLSGVLPSGVTTFSGYVIAKASFQFCHGYAFIADQTFANIAQGYLANVIPDPAVKNSASFVQNRQPSASADVTRFGNGVPAGEGLNN